MKYLRLVAVLCAVAALAVWADAVFSSEPKEIEVPVPKPTKPDIRFPSGPLPKDIVIKVLEEGFGPEAEPGDKMTVHYLAVNRKGVQKWSSWRADAPLTFELGNGDYFEAWDECLEGMKVGERREIFFPAGRSADLEPVVYVIDLLRIK
jgi:peptidylprolyl isomerase